MYVMAFNCIASIHLIEEGIELDPRNLQVCNALICGMGFWCEMINLWNGAHLYAMDSH